MLNFLNENVGALTVLFSLIVTVATVFYALLTWKLVVETTHMRRAQPEPHVAIRVQPSEAGINLILLVVENVGLGPAYDVRLSATPDFKTEYGGQLSELGIFRHGLTYMAPGTKIEFFLANVVGQVEEIQRVGGRFDFAIATSYGGASGQKYENTYQVDLRHLVGLSTIGTPPLQTIAQEVKKISDNLRKIQTGSSRIRVDVHTWEDRQREAEEWAQLRDEIEANPEQTATEAEHTPAKDFPQD